MSVKRTTAAYNDCFRVMDRILAARGGIARFPTSQKATVFRHRCYRGRAMLFKASEAGAKPGIIPSTPYDDIYILHEPGDTFLTFKLRSLDDLPEIELASHEVQDLDLD